MKLIRLVLMTLLMLASAGDMFAQNQGGSGNLIVGGRRKLNGCRVYAIGVSEGTDTYDINRKVADAENEVGKDSRGLLSEVFLMYRGAFTKKAGSIVENLINAGISEVADLVRDHRRDWEEAVNRECRFNERFSMGQEISDFYCSPSSKGPMDVNDIAFKGFTFRQYIHLNDTSKRDLDVLYARFSLDTTDIGIKRMVNHSKFQVRLDSLRFNPYICEIPNDSITDPRHSVGFDFERRKDFMISLKTTVRSSWICENMSVVKDYPLGDFLMEVNIDPAMLDPRDSCFKYSVRNPSDSLKLKLIRCAGESFMVPRSYVGYIDDASYWGTGQYRLEMEFAENCRINDQYYMIDDPSRKSMKKWDRRAWREEWRVIRRRKKFDDTKFGKALQQVSMQWTNGQWVTEIISPGASVLVSNGKKFISEPQNK